MHKRAHERKQICKIYLSFNAGIGWIILREILERWDGVMWTGLVWLRIGTGGELS
jgi:hypothetical protein